MNPLRIHYDRIARSIFSLTALLCVGILAGIFLLLLFNGIQFFLDVSPGRFFSSNAWNPTAWGQATYGVAAMVLSTFLVTVGAMAIALPLGIGTAAYLAVLAPARLRNFLKPAIEMLAAIPSVVIGFLGIVLLGPAISATFGLDNGLNALNGALLLAIMALPTIVSVSEDAIRSVPQEYREAAYALGANRWITLVSVILPACSSGLIAAAMLGMGRALGETMTVLMATGNATAMPGGWFDPVRTLTATIAIEMGETARGSTHFYGLYALGGMLFILTLTINVMAEKTASRLRRLGR